MSMCYDSTCRVFEDPVVWYLAWVAVLNIIEVIVLSVPHIIHRRSGHLRTTSNNLLHLLNPLRRRRQILIPILRHQNIIYTIH